MMYTVLLACILLSGGAEDGRIACDPPEDKSLLILEVETPSGTVCRENAWPSCESVEIVEPGSFERRIKELEARIEKLEKQLVEEESRRLLFCIPDNFHTMHLPPGCFDSWGRIICTTDDSNIYPEPPRSEETKK